MHRFYLPTVPTEDLIILPEREAHHAANVLRLRKGDEATVLNGSGGEFACVVEEVSKKRASLRIQVKKVTPPLPYKVTLFQAVPKGKLIESIIQKATELGVNRVVPLLTERVVSQVEDDRAEAKREKWQQVAIEAIKQCGQPWLPRVEAPISIDDVLGRPERFDLPLIASLQPGSRHPKDCFSEFRKAKQTNPATVSIWVGPEGDFTQREVEQIIGSGSQPITLGPLVLRCETAATYCLSFINYELQSTSGGAFH